MGSALGPLGQSGALVQLCDFKGCLLAVCPGQAVCFVKLSAMPVDQACLWVLAAAAAGTGAPAAGQAGSTTSGTCRYYLRSAATGGYLSGHNGQLQCGSAPETLQLFMDMDRRVALLLAGKACLQASPGGAALAGRLPLGGRDRPSKLFSLLESGLPRHSLRAWPLRVALRCQQGSAGGSGSVGGGGGEAGSYLSSSSGSGALSAASPVICCSEHFLLAPGEAAPLRTQAGSLEAPACRLWAADGRRLLSHEPLTGQLLLQAQHSCMGRERFTLLLSGSGELQLLTEVEEARAAPAAAGSCGSFGGTPDSPSSSTGSGAEVAGSTMQSVVVLRHGTLAAGGSASGAKPAKPARFALELASRKPTLLLTAHGQLLGCRQPGRGARPCGLTLTLPLTPDGRPTSGCGIATQPWPAPAPSPAALERCAWLLTHHGNSVYSLTHGASGCGLYLDDDGAPCLEGPGGSIVYPDERLLFWVEPGWTSLASPAGTGGTAGSSGSSSTVGGSGSSPGASISARGCHSGSGSAAMGGAVESSGAGKEAHGSSTGAAGLAAAAAEEAAVAADAASPGFVQPSNGCSLTTAGFSIRSMRRVGGRHLYLSALPGGLITTVFATGGPTRWELFTPADLQTLLESPLSLLAHVPCVSAAITAAQPQAALRRVASMQALSSTSGSSGGRGRGSGGSLAAAIAGARTGSHASLPRAPSLPAVQEHPLAEGPTAGQRLAVPLLMPAVPPLRPQPQLPEQQQEPAKPPRRCQSDTALFEMQHQQKQQQQQAGQQRRPLWLAQLLRAPRQHQGWGLTSAASLQQLACRQLCANLAAQYRCQAGSRQPPAGLVEAMEVELGSHLPQEIVTRICRDLRLLLEGPPPSKLSLQQLCKLLAAGEPKAVPAWAQPHMPEEEAALGWQPIETFLCTCCHGASGALLPLDPYINPGHHLFLHAMERTARGGGRVRLRARRRHDEDDLLLRALKAGKLLLLAWAAGRTLGAVVLGA